MASAIVQCLNEKCRQLDMSHAVVARLSGVSLPTVQRILGKQGHEVAIEAAGQAVSEGIPVVLASRATAGRVVITPLKEKQGFIVCDNLLPQKARILLMLALTVTRERKEIQQMFREY